MVEDEQIRVDGAKKQVDLAHPNWSKKCNKSHYCKPLDGSLARELSRKKRSD